MKKNILIAGIGGASLGTEIFKSLAMTEKYNIFGVDTSVYAYGLYEEGFAKTFVARKETFIEEIIEICLNEKIDAVIPGGEEPLNMLNQNRELFSKNNILLAINSPEVIDFCADKIKTFEFLKEKGIPVPMTKIINNQDDLRDINYPIIIKPSSGSGGSVFVYIAENFEEASLYLDYLEKRDIKPVVQEYMSDEEGEYSLGVLSLSNGDFYGSIALKRLFVSKLSTTMKTKDRVVSSSYSQGIVDDYEEIRAQAEKISSVCNSFGPLNIQGRIKNGVFLPFEINSRFSGGSYLRAMAGFNEVDIFLQFLLNGEKVAKQELKHGYYCRSLMEKYIPLEEIKKIGE